jgi:hypothetical protein
MLSFRRIVKAHAYQKEKNSIALIHRNFAKGLKGFSLSSVAM